MGYAMMFLVDYELDGRIKQIEIEGHDIGNAFRKCVKKYPDCTLLKGYAYRRFLGTDIWVSYDPPSTRAPDPLPAEKTEQLKMDL